MALDGPTVAPASAQPAFLSKTQEFLKNLDLARYIRNGTDFTNPDYTPEGSAQRVGKPLEKVDIVFDYDFAKLSAVEGRLRGVDRKTVLRAIFRDVTRGAVNNRDRHLKVLRFADQVSYHNPTIQPMYPNQRMVCDPLVELELGEMRCSHVARLAADLFEAAGYRTRLVELAHHVIAEVYYGRKWHYIDADAFGNGETVMNSDGSIPSVDELSRSPLRIDALAAYWEPDSANSPPIWGSPYPSYFYFSRQAWYAQHPSRAPFTYRKMYPASAYRSKFYGWEQAAVDADPGRRLHNLSLAWSPGAPQIDGIALSRSDDGVVHASLRWTTIDQDDDLAGYRVYVSRNSRGWNYDGSSLPAELMAFKSHTIGWDPSMYEARFTLPRADVMLTDTHAAAVDLALSEPGEFYVTIMPYDAHGELAGRRLYAMSEELLIRNDLPPEAASLSLLGTAAIVRTLAAGSQEQASDLEATKGSPWRLPVWNETNPVLAGFSSSAAPTSLLRIPVCNFARENQPLSGEVRIARAASTPERDAAGDRRFGQSLEDRLLPGLQGPRLPLSQARLA